MIFVGAVAGMMLALTVAFVLVQVRDKRIYRERWALMRERECFVRDFEAIMEGGRITEAQQNFIEIIAPVPPVGRKETKALRRSQKRIERELAD